MLQEFSLDFLIKDRDNELRDDERRKELMKGIDLREKPALLLDANEKKFVDGVNGILQLRIDDDDDEERQFSNCRYDLSPYFVC